MSEQRDPGLIGIMMPFYGDPELFRLAVESVVAQNDPNWHLLVIDDQYPDAAPGEWLQSLGDPRITYERNTTNLGVAGNFARCVELSDTPYTVIFGCDDLMEPGYVARMRELIRTFPDADYLQPSVTVIDAAGTSVVPLADRVKAYYRPDVADATLLSGEALATSLLRGNWTYFPSICWRTDTLKQHNFRLDLEVVLDLALQIDIVAAGGSLVLDPEPTFRYRRHEGSVSSWTANDGTRFIEERSFFIATAERLHQQGWRRAARTARHHYSSRLNAATRLPAAVRASDKPGIRSLLLHILGRRAAVRR